MMPRGGRSGGPSGLTGNWGQVNIHLRNLTRAKNKEKVLSRIGDLIAARVKQNILNMSLSMAPLTDAYHQRKIQEGYDARTLIRTGDYVDAIQITDIRAEGNSFTVVIGVDDRGTDTGLSMTELANYIEYGTSRMPGRFPFTLSWEEMRARITNETINQIKVEVQQDFGL